jgi:MSHA pilin protein MshD
MAVLVDQRRVRRPRGTQLGMSLIELAIFIAVVGIAITGVLVAYDRSIRSSADPFVRKQALAIAESLLSEVLAQAFTYCDPQDPANDPAAPPASTAACTGGVAASEDNGGALGPQPPSETRFSATDPFDNVADYNGYSMSSGIYSLDNGTTPIAGLGAYSAAVSVSRAGLALALPSDGEALRVDVTVTVGNEAITLTGYRLRHSPNATG